MAVPTHSSTCVSRAFPTKCRYCGDEVFYFFCSCGTKLLFESLGAPWPIHYCLEETEDLIETITDTYGTVDKAALNRIKILSEERGLNLSSETLDKLNNYLQKNVNKSIRRSIQPIESDMLVIGKIFSINNRINFYKRLNIQNTPIGKQLLGDFGKESFAEIVIRTLPDQNNIFEEYEIILPEKLLQLSHFETKGNIAVASNSKLIAMSKLFWCVEYIDKIK